jgi:hypothetical protein
LRRGNIHLEEVLAAYSVEVPKTLHAEFV